MNWQHQNQPRGIVTRWIDPDKRYCSAHGGGGHNFEYRANDWLAMEMRWLKDLHPDREYRVVWNQGRTKQAIKEL